MTKPNDRVINLTDHQTRFIDSDADYLCFMSGWGSGKTEAGILKIMELADENPNNLLLICRKEYTDLHDSTMKDFETYTGLTIGSNKEGKLPNGSIIMFRHAGELDVLKNINLGGYLMEQGDEFETDTEFAYLNGRVRRAGIKHYGCIVIANSNGHNWLWRKFKAGADNKGDTIRELPHPVTGLPIKFKFHLEEGSTFDCNSENLPPEFIAKLAVCKADTPEIYNRFVLNSYEESDTEYYVLPESKLRACVNNLTLPYNKHVLVSCDGSRGGADRTVIFGVQGTGEVLYKKVLRAPDTDDNTKPVYHIGEARQLIKAHYVVNDDTGCGSAITDGCRTQGYDVHPIISAAREGLSNPNKFFNTRDEMCWHLRERVIAREINIPNDEELISELSAIKYKPDSMNRIKIEPNEETKKRLGKSPDLAYAYIMAIYGFKVLGSKFPETDRFKVISEEALMERRDRENGAGKVMAGARGKYGAY